LLKDKQSNDPSACFVVFGIKFIYSEKATKLCKISTVDLTVTTQDKSTVEISQKFVAFSEYMNVTSEPSFLGGRENSFLPLKISSFLTPQNKKSSL
jgi:hypothetical protein